MQTICVICRQLRAKHVLLTVPVTVLQRGDILFTPPLPEAKQNAIQRVKMSNAVKVRRGIMLYHVLSFFESALLHFLHAL